MIRILKEEDAECFVDHLVRHFPEPGVNGVIHSPYPPDEPLDRNNFSKRFNEGISKKPGEFGWSVAWGLFDKDKIVGHIDLVGNGLKTTNHRAMLGMGIELPFRGKGYGKQLLQVAMDWVAENKFIDWIDLRVLAHNKAAIQLYESFGFKKLSRTIDQFRIQGKSIDDQRMVFSVNTFRKINNDYSNNKGISPFNPIDLQSKNIKIMPLNKISWNELYEALYEPDSYYAVNWGIGEPNDFRKLYEKYLRAFEYKKANPVVFLNHEKTQIMGMSSLMNIEEKNKMLEIGATWIGKKWRRTFVNTETKYELLAYCFEKLNMQRVEFRIDIQNQQSIKAAERMNFHCDGVMKNRVIDYNGVSRDYAFYSVINSDWPKIKDHLSNLLKPYSYQK